MVADRAHIAVLKELLTDAIGQRDGEGARQLVHPTTISQLAAQVGAWAKDRGVAQ